MSYGCQNRQSNFQFLRLQPNKKGIISLIMIVNLTTLRLVPMTNIFLCDPIAAATGRGMKTLPESLSNF